MPRSLELLDGYGRERLLADIRAGATVGLVALPLALALGAASVPLGARMPFPAPAVGIFTAIIAGFIVSALGGSRVQIAGPTAVFLPIIPLIVERYGFDGLLLATVMAGCILVAMGLARLGPAIEFIPFPVTSGFTTGIAVSVIVSQATEFLGIRSDAPAPREFLERIQWLWSHIPDINPMAAATGMSCLLLIFVWPRLGLRRVPGPLVAIVFAGLAIALIGGSHADGVATVGTRFGASGAAMALPPFTIPIISLARIRGLIAPAVTIALLGSIESLLSAAVADGLANDRHNPDTELIAQGAANIVCPFFCGLPSSGAVSRTSANVRSGGTTPVAGMVHAATLLVLVLVFSRFAQFVPMAAIAAVLMMVAFRMGEWNELNRLRHMPRADAVVLVTTFAATVLFDLVVAVEIGMVLAAFLFARRFVRTTEVTRAAAESEPGAGQEAAFGDEALGDVLVYEVSAPFSFGAAEKMEDAVEGAGKLPRVLVLRMQNVGAADATALNALESIIDRIRAAGGAVVLSGSKPQLLKTLLRAGLIGKIGRANIRAHITDALLRARELAGRTDRRRGLP